VKIDDYKMDLKILLNCTFGSASFLLSAYTIFALADFFSYNAADAADIPENGTLLWNAVLLCVFIFQHSVMKRLNFKKRLESAGLGHFERCLYVGSTNVCLLFLINCWRVSSSTLWQLESDKRIFNWLHLVCWGLIYCSTLLLDLPELLGLRQIAEHCRLLQVVECDPSLARLYSHMRHPSFTALSIILLARPTMTYDRALLATVLMSYMYLAWNPRLEDLNYQKEQWRKKKLILRNL